tara:strand:- start:404 stop:604 length:201 start_codon:yes stop_codon:yes gene_type:complete
MMIISKQLALEAFIVGVVFALTSWIALAVVPGFDLMVLFAVGAGLHLAFEASGLNKAYCRVGNACQ